MRRVLMRPEGSYRIEREGSGMGYMEYLPEDGAFTEDDLWSAIAESNGLDISDIMDGDLIEWL